MKKIKRLFLIFLAVLLSQQTICYAKTPPKNNWKTKTREFTSIIWPIFFGGGTFFFNPDGIDSQNPGYALSGGLTFFVKEEDIIDTTDVFFFVDALYSYRAYDGFPQEVHYKIEENSADIAVGVGFDYFYVGCYIQVPTNTIISVREWTIEDFEGLSRSTSFSLMGGLRAAGKHLGIDLRALLGQGPGQFMKKSLGDDHWLGQISLGLMARI